MKKKCRIILALVVSALMILLAGCGSETGDGRTRITYAIWDKNQQPAMEEIARRFEETHPGIASTYSSSRGTSIGRSLKQVR